MHSTRSSNATPGMARAHAAGSGTLARGLAALAVLLVSAAATAQKPPTLIRQHLLEHSDKDVARVKSVEPEMTAEEMHMEQRGNDYFFVDGERFGDATGYRIGTDADGRVIEYEYSWELPVEPPEVP